MFEVVARDALLDDLLAWAAAAPEVVAAASVGSRARGEVDRWSDIDLALRIAPGTDPAAVAALLTEHLEVAGVADTLDVDASGVLYRVFLMRDGLQVDVSFFPFHRFGPMHGEPMVVHFGSALQPQTVPEADWRRRAAMGWLYLVHARSAMGRRRWWQADLMLADARAELLWLAAHAQGLVPDHGRQAHLVDAETLTLMETSRPSSLLPAEVERACAAAVGSYAHVVSQLDRDLARRVVAALR